MTKINVLVGSSNQEVTLREKFYQQFKEMPIAEAEQLSNLGLFLNRQTLSRILFMNELYQKIINVHGIVIEFGVRWGQNLALFSNFRGIYEPFNYNRRIIGFDTFSGFPSIDPKDSHSVSIGDYAVTEGYETYLNDILDYHEKESPIAHKRKFDLIKGDATKTFEAYLDHNPETIVAFAYFDFDIYEPTKKCLELLLPRLTMGSIIAFDELNCPNFPGETLAVQEVLGFSQYAIKRSPLNPLISYLQIDKPIS